MKKIITTIMALLIMMSLLTIAHAQQDVLVIEFSIDGSDAVEITSIRADYGSPTEYEKSEYSIVLLDGTGQVLHTAYFTPEFTAWADGMTPIPFPPGTEIGDQGQIALDKVDVTIKVPMKAEAKTFQIHKSETVLHEGDATLCNNDGTCQPANGENYLSCYQDCESGSEDLYCDEIIDNICDPDCKAQGRPEKDTDCTCGNGVCDVREDNFACPSDCKAPMSPLTKIIIGAVIIIALIVGLIVLVKSRKKKKSK